MVTSRDVQEIVSKLSSDKARAREEGIKLLNTWLEGERSVGFCKYIGRNTAALKPNEIPRAETWPFLVTLLTEAIRLEVSASKRRLPKVAFAKTLRVIVQRAEDGKNKHLLSVAKLLFDHTWDLLKVVPSFQSEYGIILRHLLGVKYYQFHMRKRVYSSLLLLYMAKVETSLAESFAGHLNPKEDVFRCILTLHSLLDNPPGDFPDYVQDGIIKGFVGIFSHVRDEGKILRKLIECINTYLSKDGPNIGRRSLEIHDAVHQFLFQCWMTTHDRTLKDALVFYARLQLKLLRDVSDGRALLDQLLDITSKELDQVCTSCTNVPWDDKHGTLSNSHCSLVELSALVFCRACVATSKAPVADKRTRREHIVVQLNEQLMKGKWLWNAAFCCLVRSYSSRISIDLFIYWFEGICSNFERIVNDANMEHSFVGLLWTLRSLQGLFSVLHSVSEVGKPQMSSMAKDKVEKGWLIIWSNIIRGLPMLSNVTAVADAAFTLLGNIILIERASSFIVSNDVWDLRLFKGSPSVGTRRRIYI